jgi:hypothetical protein
MAMMIPEMIMKIEQRVLGLVCRDAWRSSYGSERLEMRYLQLRGRAKYEEKIYWDQEMHLDICSFPMALPLERLGC